MLYLVQVQDVANENTSQAPAAPSAAVQRDKAVSKKPAAAKKATAAKGKAKTSKIILGNNYYSCGKQVWVILPGIQMPE